MFLDAILAACVVAAASLVGALFFGNSRSLVGVQRFVVPVAVGVFLSIVLFELIPVTLAAAPTIGGIVIALGFVAFYILAQVLHQRYHHLDVADCDRRGAAVLLLVSNTIHGVADGVILGSAFLLNPAAGFAVAVGLAAHKIPLEIVEFGVLVRGGYSYMEAIVRNLLSSSSILLGTILVFVLSEHAMDSVWIITGFAAGNLLFLAASDLLPRIHGNLEMYRSVWHATAAILFGFVVMTTVLVWSHEFTPAHEGHDHGIESSEHHDDHGHAH